MLLHPTGAHPEGKPCQRVFLGARHHQENAKCDGQPTHSDHVALSRLTVLYVQPPSCATDTKNDTNTKNAAEVDPSPLGGSVLPLTS